MNLTIIEGPRTTGFVTVEKIRSVFGWEPDATRDARLTDLIEEVSAQIISFCDQPLIRQTVTERLVGEGRTTLVLSVTPVPRYAVTDVRLYGTTQSGCTVADERAGFLQAPGFGSTWQSSMYTGRFADTRNYNQWIERTLYNGIGTFGYEVDYSGGFILPGDNITASGLGVCMADGITTEFSLTDGTTFPILVSGEYITVRGFESASNNGKFKVRSRTLTSLLVEGNLITESGQYVTIQCQTLPADLEAAALREVRYRYQSERRDPTIKSESLGDWSTTYGNNADDSSEDTGGFLPGTMRMLSRYARMD